MYHIHSTHLDEIEYMLEYILLDRYPIATFITTVVYISSLFAIVCSFFFCYPDIFKCKHFVVFLLLLTTISVCKHISFICIFCTTYVQHQYIYAAENTDYYIIIWLEVFFWHCVMLLIMITLLYVIKFKIKTACKKIFIIGWFYYILYVWSTYL